MKKSIYLILTILLLVAFACPVFADEIEGIQTGDTMPDFTVDLTDGSTVSLKNLSDDYKGETITSGFNIGKVQQIAILYFAFNLLLSVIGRWRIFVKAGKKGWYSLIPIWWDYQEYDLCWVGWLGLLPVVFYIGPMLLGMVSSSVGSMLSLMLLILSLILRLIECMKLSKAFGKGAIIGILLYIFPGPGRLILGLSKAPYQPELVGK